MAQRSTKELLEEARGKMREGKWAEAEGICQGILQKDAGQAGANHLLGVIAGQLGKVDEAIGLIQKAIAADGRVAEYYGNLSVFLFQRGRITEAAESARAALRLSPTFAAAWNNLGHSLFRLGKKAESASAFGEAARCDPDSAEYARAAARAMLEVGKTSEAVVLFGRVAELTTGQAKADALYDLGIALTAEGRLEEAKAAYEKSLAINGRDERTWNNYGNTLKRLGEVPAAIEALKEAVRLKPGWAEALCNLGGALLANLEIEKANATFAEALRAAPEQAVIHYNHGVLRLLQRDFERGWPEYEWRWKCVQVVHPTRFKEGPWRGEPLEGKRIMLHAEQGLGDTIQFVRYVPMVIERGGRVVLCVQPELRRLLEKFPGVEAVASRPGDLPACQAYRYLMDLPGTFGTNAGSIPCRVPYVEADGELCEVWRKRIEAAEKSQGRGTVPLGGLSPYRGFRVGIAWAGRSTHANNLFRSMKLAMFEPLGAVEGVMFFSMQKGAGSEEAGSPPGTMKLVDLTAGIADFADTAGLVANLDLVITVDSAMAHLAGAMGKRVWILVPYCPDWRWMLAREDSPWYPTAKLFRQAKRGDWESVVERVKLELLRLTKEGVRL